MTKVKLLFIFYFCTAFFVFSEEAAIHYSGEIILTGEKDYKEIILDRDVITRAAYDFRDIRIVNEEGNPVPYFIYNSLTYEKILDTFFGSEYLGSFIKDGDEYFDFKILKKEHSDVYGNHLEITTLNSGFAETVALLGSHDGNNWVPVTEAFIYDVRTFSQKTIPFGRTEKYSYYRIKAAEHTLQPDSLKLIYTEMIQDRQLFTREFHPAFEIEEKDQNTLITIPKNEIRYLHIDSIQFETGGTFQREVAASYKRDEIYRFPFRGELLEKNYIILDRRSSDNDLVITIFNGDDRPLEVKNVTLFYRFQKLVFNAGEGNSFFLEYGDYSLTKPDYDIRNYGEYILREGVDPCTIGHTKETPSSKPRETPVASPDSKPQETLAGMPIEKFFMNVSIVLAALILLIVIIAGLKKHGSP